MTPTDRPRLNLGRLDDGAGPARILSQKRAEEMIDAAFATANARVVALPSRARRFVPLVAAATVCLALLGALAYAALHRGRWSAHSMGRNEAPIPAAATQVTSVASALSVPPAPAPEVAPEPPSTSIDSLPPARAVAPVPAPSAAPGATALEGDDMLRQANELRAQRRWAESLALYERIMRTFPGTPQAYSSGVSAAYLRLDHTGDARGALLLFQSLARREPGGSLSEEIDWGVARAYRALGDAQQEAKALEAFAINHPESPRISALRARMREIE
jgi:hypothetical protein